MTHELLLCLQDLRESLPDAFTSVALFFSSPIVYLVIPMAIAAAIYLCSDERKAEWMILNISSGAFIGHFLKDLICNPRPWVVDDRIHPIEDAIKDASGYSTPSGHATESTAGFGSLIAIARRRWATVLLIIVIFFVISSRLFLGVHTLTDVVLGLILAIAVMTVNWFLVKISYADDHNYDAVTVFLIILFIASSLTWYLVSENTAYIMRYGGLMLGTIIGRHLGHHLLDHEVGKVTVTKNILRCLVGLTVVAVCFVVPYAMLGPDMGSAVGGFLASIGMFLVAPVLLGALNLNS